MGAHPHRNAITPLGSALATGARVNDAVIDVDRSGGNQATRNVLPVGTAAATGAGITLDSPLAGSHVIEAPVRPASASAIKQSLDYQTPVRKLPPSVP